MKLLTEYIAISDLQILTEDVANDKAKKIYRIKGPYLQSEVKNRNGRIYGKHLCEREINTFQDKIVKRRALGELDHPPTPTVNLNNVSHLIESLQMDGNDGIGVSKLLDTPKGLVAQILIKEGILLGVSTRGVGTLTGDLVNDDYKLITVDIVADPSAPGTFVDGILENKEYIITEGGDIVEKAVNNLENKLVKQGNSKILLSYMREFLEDIRKKI
jgi:hypothetical protein